jgi:5'-phosphate synthase pdxT subunit
MRIGVLALQGDFIEHIHVLDKLGVEAIPVRKPDELEGLDGLIIPGGESITILNLMHSSNLLKPLKEIAQAGLPIMGTCAGMVLIANKVSNSNMDTLSLMDMVVRRNAFGRQLDSFETELAIPALGEKPFPAIFIRAPFIDSTGPQVDILAKLDSGIVVAARQGRLLAIAFHPELSNDPRLHQYFLETIATNDIPGSIGRETV